MSKKEKKKSPVLKIILIIVGVLFAFLIFGALFGGDEESEGGVDGADGGSTYVAKDGINADSPVEPGETLDENDPRYTAALERLNNWKVDPNKAYDENYDDFFDTYWAIYGDDKWNEDDFWERFYEAFEAEVAPTEDGYIYDPDTNGGKYLEVEDEYDDIDLTYGSCNNFYGRTVIVSVFVSDSVSKWDREKDAQEMYTQLNSVKIAMAWLAEQSAKYGAQNEFIYDWSENNDLFQEATINADLRDHNTDYMKADYIYNNGNFDTIRKKYKADNVEYIFFVNQDSAEGGRSFASVTRPGYESYSNFEYVTLFKQLKGYRSSPSTIAHETMHCFGAPDLYGTTYDADRIPDSYVTYLRKNRSNDIMFTVYDYNKKGFVHMDHISNDFTDVDAYYLGISQSAGDVTKFGLTGAEK